MPVVNGRPDMNSDFCVVLASCPDDDTAQKLAEGLIGRGLAACVNILSGMVSVYLWQGRLETSRERLLLIKTRRRAFESVQAYVLEHHPYELPEIIAVPIEAGLPAYLQWLDGCVSPEADS
jgi:periplasmic divalent cation tolerance protein